jgi:hypothetical protein
MLVAALAAPEVAWAQQRAEVGVGSGARRLAAPAIHARADRKKSSSGRLPAANGPTIAASRSSAAVERNTIHQTGFEVPPALPGDAGNGGAPLDEPAASEFLDNEGPQAELPEWPHPGADDAQASPEAPDPSPDAVRGRVAPADQQPTNREYAPRLELPPVPESEEDTPAQRRLRAQLARPFKKISEIRPYFDYEPDAETLKQDRCFNLCPRPGSPDCPECETPEGEPGTGGLVCPECPVELDLRDSSRYTGQAIDFPVRNFPHIHYCWEPTNLYSLPLYFQDPCLERYGHTRHYLIQPVFSGALFAVQFLGLPYQMSIDPVWKKRYALGWYRPGQYVPYKYYQIPWNTQAALTEAGVVTGAYFLFAPGVSP